MEVPVIDSLKPAPRGLGARLLVHTSLLAVFAAVGGALLVWPQWIAVEGSRAALQIQQEREEGLEARFGTVQAMNDRLRAWNSEERKVFLPAELRTYPDRVRAVADREGAKVLGVRIGGPAAPRWHSLAGAAGMWADAGEARGGEIRPVAVKMSFVGPFDAVYRTVVALGQEGRLVLPDRWQLEPRALPGGAPRQVRAEVTAAVFLVREAAEPPVAPVVSGRLAAAAPLETE